MLQAHIDVEAGSRQSTCHEVMEVARWTEGIERPDLRRLPGLVERKNGWHEGGGGRRHTRRGAAPDVNPCEGRGGLYIRDAGLVDNGLRNYVVGHPGNAHGELAVDGTARPRENEGRFSRQVTRRSECSGSTAARRYGWNR